jgi:putative FmdB family regulatory protein
MPIYDYVCDSCGLQKSFQHSYEEKIETCPSCGASKEFKKVLTSFRTSNKHNSKDKKIGDLTKQYIEENRKVLEDQKKELRKEKT